MQIEVTTPLKTEAATSKTGKQYTRREQEVFIHVAGEKYPLKSRISVPEDLKEGYALGKYEIDFDKTIKIGKYGPEWGYDTYLGKKVA